MSNQISVIDNFLDVSTLCQIKNIILGNNFPWYYEKSIVTLNLEEISDPDTYQFIHTFFNIRDGGICSHQFNILKPIMDKLNIKSCLRIKSNLLTRSDNPKYFEYHTDYNYPTGKTAIFYINTNNGCTIFEDGTEIGSMENRMVIFNNNIRHTGKTCSDKSIRVLINFNYFDW